MSLLLKSVIRPPYCLSPQEVFCSSLRAKRFPAASSFKMCAQRIKPRSHNTTTFSTMTSLRSDMPASVAGVRDFDPEIKDMASYIHNYKIDSDLAVSERPIPSS